MKKLELKNVMKKYDKANDYSVKNFNLEVEEGEFVVLVGPSGCGKSTTLRMIAGLEDITEGEFLIEGKKVNDMPSKERDISMVFQSYALYPHMNVEENIGYGLKLRKEQKEVIKEKVQASAEYLMLDDYLDRKPKDLSGGQRQRVALARAIVRTPKLYLMDEPLSNLDAKLRASTRVEIMRIHREKGVVTVYVTHDQIEAMTMADRIVCMSMGEIQQIGTPKELFLNPKNEFVATFIGQPSMNIIKGDYKEGTFSNEHMQIKLTDSDVKILNEKGYEGKEILLGVRANAISDNQLVKSSFPNATITVKPVNVEYLGDHTNIFFVFGDSKLLVATVSANEIPDIDKDYDLNIEATKLHFFDAVTKEAIKYVEK